MIIDDIALTLLPRLGIRTVNHLLGCFPSAEAVFAASADELMERAELKPEFARLIASKASHPDAEKEMEFILKNRIRAICSTDDDYPQRLLECADYPHVLYVKGPKEFNAGAWLSVVGTRKITPYGVKMCDSIIGELASLNPATTIVSGLAFGVDVEAHRAALRHGLQTVGVVAHGLTHIYPARHTETARRMVDEGGAVITEFASNSTMDKACFVQRNRIIAGLSDATLIVESAARAGSLITADMADGYNRTLFAVPGRVGDQFSEGTNRLIRSLKAQMATSGRDIAETMDWAPAMAAKPDAKQGSLFAGNTPVEAAIIAMLGTDPLPREEIVGPSGISFAEVAEALLMLELSGHIRLIPGRGYIKLA